jgi:hypothetical protein
MLIRKRRMASWGLKLKIVYLNNSLQINVLEGHEQLQLELLL